jgi:hypothetical protein
MKRSRGRPSLADLGLRVRCRPSVAVRIAELRVVEIRSVTVAARSCVLCDPLRCELGSRAVASSALIASVCLRVTVDYGAVAIMLHGSDLR